MINQFYTGTPTSRRFVLFPNTVVAGQPLLVGGEPCVALDSYQANLGGATCLFNGTFALTIIAESAESPVTGKAIKPGDPIYAVGGTLDAATNVTTGFVLNADSSGVLFGHADPSYGGLTSGQTDTAGLVALNAL